MNIYHRGDVISILLFWDENGFRDENGNEIAVQTASYLFILTAFLFYKPVYNVIFYFAYPKG